MFEQCKAEYKGMISRIEAVIKDKYPETLRGDGSVWSWLDETRPETRTRQRDLVQRLNVAWQNGILAEVKQLSLDWGRLQLEIFKGYSTYLKEQQQ